MLWIEPDILYLAYKDSMIARQVYTSNDPVVHPPDSRRSNRPILRALVLYIDTAGGNFIFWRGDREARIFRTQFPNRIQLAVEGDVYGEPCRSQ